MNYKVPDAPGNLIFNCYGCGRRVSVPYMHKEHYIKEGNGDFYFLCPECIRIVNRAIDTAVKELKDRSVLK